MRGRVVKIKAWHCSRDASVSADEGAEEVRPSSRAWPGGSEAGEYAPGPASDPGTLVPDTFLSLGPPA